MSIFTQLLLTLSVFKRKENLLFPQVDLQVREVPVKKFGKKVWHESNKTYMEVRSNSSTQLTGGPAGPLGPLAPGGPSAPSSPCRKITLQPLRNT